MGYTPDMHSIDRKWSDLAEGYRDMQASKTKLEAETGEAVSAGAREQYVKELSEWQKKRRIFFGLAAVAVVSIIGLCLTAFFFRDVACVIIYWALLVAVILVTLAVAGRQYVAQMVSGKPVLRREGARQRNWRSAGGGRWNPHCRRGRQRAAAEELCDVLSKWLPETTIARCLADDELICMGAGGMWLFIVADRNGRTKKEEGSWGKKLRGGFWGRRKPSEDGTQATGPEGRWWSFKKKVIEKALPKGFPAETLVRGGVVEGQGRVKAGGGTIPHGGAKGWAGRMREAPEVEGFSAETQLEMLDRLP